MLKKNGFVLALLGAILLAYLNPRLGAPGGPLKADTVTRLGVMIVFLIQGLSLRTRDLAGGLRHLRIHGFIQGWIFLLSAVVLATLGLVLKWMSMDQLANGFFYLALVPTTISSAVAFTAAASGNVPIAIFNTTVSNVIGVFWVPAWCLAIFAAGGNLQMDLLGPLLWKITRLILIPMLAGQLLRPLVFQASWFRKASSAFKYINQGIILFIVYAAFCSSIASRAWSGIGAFELSMLMLFVISGVLLIHAGTWLSSRWVTTNQADRIAIFFCGSQKTLAAGAPLAVAIFSGNEYLTQYNLGLLLLPLISYHPLQLILAAALLPKLSLSR